MVKSTPGLFVLNIFQIAPVIFDKMIFQGVQYKYISQGKTNYDPWLQILTDQNNFNNFGRGSPQDRLYQFIFKSDQCFFFFFFSFWLP